MRVIQTAVWSFYLDEAGQGARDTRVRCAVRVVEIDLPAMAEERLPVLLPVMQLILNVCARSAG